MRFQYFNAILSNLTPFPRDAEGKRFRLGLWPGAAARRLPGLVAKLDDKSRELDGTSMAVERRFVAVGALFAKQVLLNGKLVGEGERLMRLSGAQENSSGIMQVATGLIQQALDFVETNSKRTDELLAHFEIYQQQIRGVQKGKEQLAQTLVPLQIIERLFRIESAALPQKMQTAFESLTQEISTLHQQMRKTLSHQFDAMVETEVQIDRTKKRLFEHSVRLRQRVEETRVRIDEGLIEIDTNVSKNRVRNQRLASVTRQMESETNQVMLGLQYQDIMRQKTEHIKEATDEILQNFSNPRRGSAIPPEHLDQICRLEAHQLQAISEGLEQASRDIGNGIRGIFQCLEEIDRDCLPLSELKQAITSVDAMVDTLLAALRDSRELLTLSLQGVNETFLAIESFGGNATNVTSTLRQLAQDIKLIALNAQVQAAQMGGGTGLEVLSEQTCELSEETGQFTRAIGEELNELIRTLQSVIGECGEAKNTANGQLSRLDEHGDSLMEALRQHQAESSDVLHQLAQQLEQSHENANTMRQKNDFSNLSQDALVQMRALFLEIAHCAQRSKSRSTYSHTSNHMLERLNGRYTMDSERAIHAATIGLDVPSNWSSLNDGSSEVEFFESLAAASPADTSPLEQRSSSALASAARASEPEPEGNIELF